MSKLNPFLNEIVRQYTNNCAFNIIDVGAMGGIDPTLSYFIGKGNVKAYGFEPAPKNFEVLKNTHNITYFPYAVGDITGEVEFYAFSGVGSLSRREDREERFNEVYDNIKVKIDTLDNLRDTKVIPSIDILKIDVEGHEMDVLNGGVKHIADETLCVKAEFSFDDESGNSFDKINRYMVSNNFILFDFAVAKNHVNALYGGDVLFLKDVSKLCDTSKSNSETINKIIKLIVVSVMMNYRKYAYVCVNYAYDNGVFNEDEYNSLSEFITSEVYLPEIVPSFKGKFVLSKIIFVLTQLLSERMQRKSDPKDNQLAKSSRLWVDKKYLPKFLLKKSLWNKDFRIY